MVAKTEFTFRFKLFVNVLATTSFSLQDYANEIVYEKG